MCNYFAIIGQVTLGVFGVGSLYGLIWFVIDYLCLREFADKNRFAVSDIHVLQTDLAHYAKRIMKLEESQSKGLKK